MKCWHCDGQLIWGGDHESDLEDFVMETNLHCPECHSLVLVYFPRQPPEDDAF